MSSLREKILQHTINGALEKVRREMCEKFTPKKEGRFFTDGITFEIGAGKLGTDGIVFEISSKIPVEKLPKKGDGEKYYKDVKKNMLERKVKPVDVKMENIIHSTNINEIKERDYVKCSYLFKESDLYTENEVSEIVKESQAKKVDLSGIAGVSTLAGKAVVYCVSRNMHKMARTTIGDLIESNAEAVKGY